MAKRNALLEWLDQTKKLAKSRDYAFLDLVDKIFEVIAYIDRAILLRHKKLFDYVCTQYHKPNPLNTPLKRSGDKASARSKTNSNRLLNVFVEHYLAQAEIFQKDVLWQWFEIIDFMFERPELINPKSIDEYTEERINFVCTTYRKNNPLKDGVRELFGKFWKDETGKLRPERRQRF